MRKIKVLIVEDSLVFQHMLVSSLGNDPSIDIVAAVSDPFEARDAIIKFKPDVMTLDVELPKMDGIEFLKKLMPQYPIPVVMVSSLSERVFDALNAGAVDFVCKPEGMNAERLEEFMKNELTVKVKIASTVDVSKLKRLAVNEEGTKRKSVKGERIIAIGASTGGTEAIFDVIKEFDKEIPGTVVVQHMPPGFTRMYAERLNRTCQVSVKEAQTGDKVVKGQVLIAPGNKQMKILKVNGVYQVECKEADKVNGHCPSVDVLFHSVAKVVGNAAIGIILTGMGRDGAAGLLAMRQTGAKTLGQDEESCIVYGMPKEAYQMGGVEYQLGLHDIARKVYHILSEK